MNLKLAFPLTLLLTATCGLFMSAPSNADDRVWAGTGTAFWADPANWKDGDGNPVASEPTSSDTVYYNGSGTQTSRGRTMAVLGLVFNNTGATKLAGGDSTTGNGSLAIGSGGILINPGAGAVTLGDTLASWFVNPVTLGTSQSWTNNSLNTFTRAGAVGANTRSQITLGSFTLTVNGSGNTVMNQHLTGTGGSLIKSGGGSLTISGAGGNIAAYTGSTSVSAGSLILTSDANINSTSGISVGAAGTFTNNNATVAFAKPITLAEGGKLNGTGAFAPTALNISANLGDGFTTFNLGSASLTKDGAFELTLSGITGGNYTLFTGTTSAEFDSMTIGGVALGANGSGNFSGQVGEYNYEFTNATNQLKLSAIPEPTTAALAALGSLLLATRRRTIRRIVAE